MILMNETWGCDNPPDGGPIGGGNGYSRMAPRGDFRATTAEDLLAALKQAQPGQTIFIPDGVEIDLAGHENIDLPAGITLAGTRGLGDALGARLVMRRKLTGSYYLFQTTGPKVRLTGLRFEGPDGDNAQRNGYVNFIQTKDFGLEVDNCEIFNWGYGAVIGQPGAGGIKVHHCHIHHCQGAAHDGYGVCLDACDAQVVANRFSHIRNHAIAGTGKPGTAYEAAYNWVDGNFDMHGGADRGDGTHIGGDWMEIHHNTFLQISAMPCITRGIPSQGAQVHHNRFQAPVMQAIGRSREDLAKINIQVWRNIHGPDGILEE